jgi:hypothetical protein
MQGKDENKEKRKQGSKEQGKGERERERKECWNSERGGAIGKQLENW